MYEYYFNTIGYKVANPSTYEYVIEDFQRHAGLKADRIIGPKTKKKIAYYNHRNYCPEVFEPIKPYVPYSDSQIESLMQHGLVGLGAVFNKQSKINNIDVLHNVNHAALESGYGTSKIAKDKNNLYGWAAYDSSPYASAQGYRDYEDCIETWTREYNNLYLESSGGQYRGNNEYCVNVVYASSSIAGINKSFITQQMRNKLLVSQVDYLPSDAVPGAPDFIFKEGYSNTEIDGVRKIKVDPIPDIYMDNAIKVFQNLQLIRDHFGVPVIISTSGNLYRNGLYNIAIGGASKSQHLTANGADIHVVGIPSKTVYQWSKDNTDFMGHGIINNNWIHQDLRDVFWYKEY